MPRPEPVGRLVSTSSNGRSIALTRPSFIGLSQRRLRSRSQVGAASSNDRTRGTICNVTEFAIECKIYLSTRLGVEIRQIVRTLQIGRPQAPPGNAAPDQSGRLTGQRRVPQRIEAVGQFAAAHALAYFDVQAGSTNRFCFRLRTRSRYI